MRGIEKLYGILAIIIAQAIPLSALDPTIPLYLLNGNIGIGTTTPFNRLTVATDGPSDDIQGLFTNTVGGAGIELNRTATHRAAQILFSTNREVEWYVGVVRRGGSQTSGFHFTREYDVHAKGSVMTLSTNGNVGIGTTLPATALHVKSPGTTISTFESINAGNFAFIGLKNAAGQNAFIGNDSAGTLHFQTPGRDFSSKLVIDSYGKVGIGTTSPSANLDVRGDVVVSNRVAINAPINSNYQLTVGGTIKAEDMILNLENWADYVFEKNYPLLPIKDVDTFIKINKHLPGVPSEKELKKSGLSLAKMQVIQMQKIEELTLYIIQLESRIKALEEAKK